MKEIYQLTYAHGILDCPRRRRQQVNRCGATCYLGEIRSIEKPGCPIGAVFEAECLERRADA